MGTYRSLVDGGSLIRGKGSGGGCKGFGSGGVGGRDPGPATCVVFVVSNVYKKKKNGVF